MEARFAEVRAALDAVYNGSGDNHSKADKWLQQFQQTSEAWSIADALLRMPDAELQVTFFAAMTIHSKIRFDFHELPAEAVPSLKSSLVSHLTKWATAQDKRPAVVTRLCLTLAALAVQTNWTGAVQELTSAIMASAAPEQQGRAARVVLELMKVLPEECANNTLVVADSTRDAFQEHLCNSSAQLLRFLAELAQGPHCSDVMVQELIFQCLQSWVRFCSIPPEQLSAHPLFPAAFDALASPDLFEAAVDLLVEVLRTYCRPRQSMAIVQVTVPKAMALKDAFLRSVVDEDEDVARGLARLFTEMGESYMEMLMWQEDLNQQALVDMLLMCTSHPTPEIAMVPLNFWYTFCRELDRLEPRELKQSKLTAFAPSLTSLIEVLLRLMRYPEDIDQRTDDQVDDLKQHRYDVSDVLTDCCRVLGGVYVLSHIVGRLEHELAALSALPADAQATAWHTVEACLFGVRTVARSVPEDDATSVPRIMTLLPLLPRTSHVRYTANQIVGRYSGWLRRHPTVLSTMMDFLLQGFSSAECAAAAATSLKSVCEDCGSIMGETGLGLYDHLQAVKAVLQFKDELEILEGLCHVMSTLPVATATQALHRILQPIATHLADPSEPLKATLQDLGRLAVLLQHANPVLRSGEAHPAIAVMLGLWQVLSDVAHRHPASAGLAEKLCRCYKHGLRSAGAEQFAPLLQPLAAQLVTNFAAAPHSPYLYCASICVVEYGRSGGSSEVRVLIDMLLQMSRTVSTQLSGGLPQLVAQPDLVEEYFYLIARFAIHCPDALLSTQPLPDEVVSLGLLGLQLQHREAHKGILHCLEELIALGSRSNTSESCQRQVQALISTHGSRIVVALVGCCTQELPAYALDDGSGSVAGSLWKLALLCRPWLQQWLAAALSAVRESTATAQQRTEFAEALVAPAANRDSVEDAVRRFSSLCWQNSRRWNTAK